MIAYARGVSLRRRVTALIAAATNKNVDVLWRIISSIEDTPALRDVELLEILGNNQDDEIASAAKEIAAAKNY
jgi:hypothetical protein